MQSIDRHNSLSTLILVFASENFVLAIHFPLCAIHLYDNYGLERE